MTDSDPKPESWLSGMRRSADSVLGLLQGRLELFSVELQEEKLRTLQLLLWLGLAFTLGAAGLLVIIGALAIFLWTVAGYWGLIGLAVVTLAGAAGVVWHIRRQILSGPTPFHTTANEFRKDREWLRGKE